MNYAIIGAITKYTPQDIKPWVDSIKQSSFKGGKFMLTYEVPSETISFLQKEGFEVFDCGNLPTNLGYRPIVVYRFRDLYRLLTSDFFDYDRVIVTDVKDVIFQSNPIEWMDKNLTHPLLVGSESILCKDMEWSRRNYSSSFPLEWERIQDKLSYCAGIIAGDTLTVADLFLAIYRWSLTGASTYEPPDQAAMNVLVELETFRDKTQKVTHKNGWVTHLGVALDKPEQFGPYLKDSVPVIKDGKIYNEKGDLFTIIHQYDRIKYFKYTP